MCWQWWQNNTLKLHFHNMLCSVKRKFEMRWYLWDNTWECYKFDIFRLKQVNHFVLDVLGNIIQTCFKTTSGSFLDMLKYKSTRFKIVIEKRLFAHFFLQKVRTRPKRQNRLRLRVRSTLTHVAHRCPQQQHSEQPKEAHVNLKNRHSAVNLHELASQAEASFVTNGSERAQPTQ